MITKTLTGADFVFLVKQGAAQLQLDKNTVNDLNVFPIPDGDTGDNMFMTIDSGCKAAPQEGNLEDAAAALSQGMLLGARGNSGVILSRIFAGISRGLKGVREADPSALKGALARGVEEAYKAVAVPVEGTMLTVYREAVEAAGKGLTPDSTFGSFGEDFLREMEASLERTPELLDVLKKAGVIDSGGAGLVSIARGIMKALAGETLTLSDTPGTAAKPLNLNAFTEDSALEFGYCTEFLLRLQRAKTNPDTFDEKVILDYLQTVGDSIVCFKDGSIVKVHVHTRRPGDVLSHCQQWGEFLTLKIENMTLQHHETTIHDGFSKPKKRYGVVTVASGDGLVATFREAGADVVIPGGQTMNPAVQSFLEAFDQVAAGTIFVFPNNANILLTARQAASLYQKARVRVIPSKSVGQGYAAIASLDADEEDADALQAQLEETMAGVETGMVSRAVRDAEGGVKEGDYLGFVHGKILTDSPDRSRAALQLCEAIGAGDRDVVLVFRGGDVPAEEAEGLEAALTTRFPMTEFIFRDGGQPVYDYIMILC